jgi:hypothetical protein
MMTNLNLTNLNNANANLNNYNNSPSKLILPQLNASVVSGGSAAAVGSRIQLVHYLFQHQIR